MATVLIADDHEFTRKMHTRVLRRCGHDILVAEDGEEVVGAVREALAAGGSDLICFLDAHMPPDRLGGLWAAETLISELGIAPNRIFLVSADVTETTEMACRRLGVTFLRKPLEVATLRELADEPPSRN